MEQITAALTVDDQLAAALARATDVAAAIETRYDDYLSDSVAIKPRHHHWASTCGEACTRRLYHDVVDWQNMRPFDLQAGRYFLRGNLFEHILKLQLTTMGFDIRGGQDKWHDKSLRISAKVDGFVALSPVSREATLIEVKSTSVGKLADVRTVGDLRESPYGRKYYAQCQIYMYVQNVLACILLIVDANTFKWRALPFGLDWDYADGLVRRLQYVNGCIDAKTPPDYHNDQRECRRCPHHQTSCFPPSDYGDGVQIITDEDLPGMLDEIDALAAAAARYKQLCDDVKGRLRTRGDTLIVGDWVVENRRGAKTTYDIPADVKAKYKVEDPTGRVTTTWHKMGGDMERGRLGA